jgi:hypothetical protein
MKVCGAPACLEAEGPTEVFLSRVILHNADAARTKLLDQPTANIIAEATFIDEILFRGGAVESTRAEFNLRLHLLFELPESNLFLAMWLRLGGESPGRYKPAPAFRSWRPS